MKSPMIGYGKCYRTSFHLLELLHHLVSSSLLLFYSSTLLLLVLSIFIHYPALSFTPIASLSGVCLFINLL